MSIQNTVSSGKRKEDQPSSSSRKKQKTFIPRISRMGLWLSGPRPYQGFQPIKTVDMFPLPSAQTCEAGFPSKARIPRLWDSVVPIINGTSANTVCSFSPHCGLEGLVSISGCCTSTFYFTDMPKRPRCGSRLRTRLTDRDFRDLGACLRHHTTD